MTSRHETESKCPPGERKCKINIIKKYIKESQHCLLRKRIHKETIHVSIPHRPFEPQKEMNNHSRNQDIYTLFNVSMDSNPNPKESSTHSPLPIKSNDPLVNLTNAPHGPFMLARKLNDVVKISHRPFRPKRMSSCRSRISQCSGDRLGSIQFSDKAENDKSTSSASKRLELTEKMVSNFRLVAQLWLKKYKTRLEMEAAKNRRRFDIRINSADDDQRNKASEIIKKHEVSRIPQCRFFKSNVANQENKTESSMYTTDKEGHIIRKEFLNSNHLHNKSKNQSSCENATNALTHYTLKYARKRMNLRVEARRKSIEKIHKGFNNHQNKMENELREKLAIRKIVNNKLSEYQHGALYLLDKKKVIPSSQRQAKLTKLCLKKGELKEKCWVLLVVAAMIKKYGSLPLQNTDGNTKSVTKLFALLQQLIEKEVILTQVVADTLFNQLTEEDLFCPKTKILVEFLKELVNNPSILHEETVKEKDDK